MPIFSKVSVGPEGWGAKVVDRLSRDLRAEFPEMGGLSRSNLLSMRALAEAFPDEQIVQQLVGQIPWGHNVLLIARVKDPAAREWYARQTVKFGWSRAVLTLQIESQAHARSGRAITNFKRMLPPEQSDLAREVLKDPYMFDFLTLADDAVERDLERGLIEHVAPLRFLSQKLFGTSNMIDYNETVASRPGRDD